MCKMQFDTTKIRRHLWPTWTHLTVNQTLIRTQELLTMQKDDNKTVDKHGHRKILLHENLAYLKEPKQVI